MSERLGLRVLIVAAVVVTAVVVSITQPVRLGLDLRGGTQVVLEARDTDTVTVDGDVTDRTLEVLRRRVDGLGVAEPTLQRSGDRRIIVELPGLDDPEQAIEVIGRTAQLTFHAVIDAEPPTSPPPDGQGTVPDDTPDGEDVEPDETGTDGEADDDAPADDDVPVDDQIDPEGDDIVVESEDGERLVLAPASVTGAEVSDAAAILTSVGTWEIRMEFHGGGQSWAELTGQAACSPPGDPSRRVAVVLDSSVIMSPQVDPSVQCGVGLTGGDTVVRGQYTQAEAQDLALLVRAGALPVPVEIVEQRTVGPTLGQAAIDASVDAALLGIALTAGFLLLYYRFLGAVAAIALGLYALIALAALQAINATLTLPGIAGFVLAVGMAVDGNILVFERVKEEHADRRSLRSALFHGFHRAWTAIIDSNVTTLIAAVMLYLFASGGVRGFGITLAIGVVASMFTSLVVTRVLLQLAVRWGFLRQRIGWWGLDVARTLRERLLARNPAVIGRARTWFTASGLVVALALVGIGTQGLNYGLDFTGGRLVEYSAGADADLDEVRTELAEIGIPRAIVNRTGDDNVVIRTRSLSPAEVEQVDDVATEVIGSADRVREEFVGPTIGAELRQRALITVAMALAAQQVYLMVRFRWNYASAAVLGLAHNVVILLGAFAWLGKDIDAVFIASLLTVIGYSVNDTVVIFDRVRERFGLRPDEPLREVANDAVLETLPRTVNTGMSTLFVLFSLWFLAGDTLADFALALIIGISVGMYSSVCIATPFAITLNPNPPPPTPSTRRPSEQVDPTTRGREPVRTGPAKTPIAPKVPQGGIPPRPRQQKRRGRR